MAVNIWRRRACELCKSDLMQPRQKLVSRLYSATKLTNREIRLKRNALFEEERQRQKSFIKRIEKISVRYTGQPQDMELEMNRDLSTPYNCAMYLGEVFAKRAVVARVNGQLWDMHRPLTESCDLELLHMLDEDAEQQNQVFWRTCSFILGYVLEDAFKHNIHCELCFFPKPDVRSGSFVYDVDLGLPDWRPTFMELNSLSLKAMSLIDKKYDFERLEVDADLALRMFEDNSLKSSQIPSIAQNSSQERITLYRMGNHVDITAGPLIADTSQIGRFTVTATHNLYSETHGCLTRFQGVALPRDVTVHNSVYEYLCRAAKKRNLTGIGFYRKRNHIRNEETRSEEAERIAN